MPPITTVPRHGLRGLDVRLPEAELNRREGAERVFLATLPKHGCRACSQNNWHPVRSAEEDEHGTGWQCRNCGRPPLSEAEWNSELGKRNAEAAAAVAADNTPAATRGALTLAIERRTETREELARLEAVRPQVEEVWSAAWRVCDEITAALRTAPSDGERLIDAYTHDGEPRKSKRVLEQELAAADDARVAAREARDVLEKRIEETRASLSRHEGRVRDAAARCVAAHSAKALGRFAADTEALLLQLVERRQALAWLRQRGVVDNTAEHGDIRRVAGLLTAMFTNVPDQSVSFAHEIAPRGANAAGKPAGPGLIERYEATLAALCADAAAPAVLA